MVAQPPAALPLLVLQAEACSRGEEEEEEEVVILPTPVSTLVNQSL